MLRGWRLGKPSRLQTSKTAAPTVSASSTVGSKPSGMRAAYSVSSNGLSAFTSISAAWATTACSGAMRDGTFTADAGGIVMSSVSGVSCSAES